MATIHDVARECGVSVTTVSTVLNNAPRPVRAAVRARVIETAQRLNYHPSAVARGLVHRRTRTLGLLFSVVESAIVTNHYAVGVLEGIFREAAERGYEIHLHTRPWEGEAVSAARIRAQRSDGILVVAPPIGSDIASSLHRLGAPLVVVSAPAGVGGVTTVDVDNRAGARLAAQHLLALGHRRIAHLMGDPAQASVCERRDAFRAALAEAGIELPDAAMVGASFDFDVAYATTRTLLVAAERPTALFVTTDSLALQALHAARDLGLRVPEDLSVIGFDDFPLAPYLAPPLTTVHHPLARVGAMAVALLIDRIEGREAPGRVLLDPYLVVRGSTAPPAGGQI